ncbi:hypothetical protein M8J77_005371 [Diaphorina citri]|nr:hypothetical protein M8J77_005371 [Diaphorina citri]
MGDGLETCYSFQFLLHQDVKPLTTSSHSSSRSRKVAAASGLIHNDVGSSWVGCAEQLNRSLPGSALQDEEYEDVSLESSHGHRPHIVLLVQVATESSIE